MKLFLLVVLLLASCSDRKIHAQSGGSVGGTYIFKSQGFHGQTPFFEAGIVTTKTDGTYHVSSTYNSGGEIRHVEQDGISTTISGNEGESFSGSDAAHFYTTDDHSLQYAVGVTRDST